jgi:hypothetical protein
MAAPFTNLVHYEPSVAEVELLFAFQPTYAYVGPVPVRRSIEGGEAWGVGPVFLTPDADTLATCNAETTIAVMRALVGPPRSENEENGLWDIVTVAHWGRGAIDHLAVKVTNDDGTLTPAARLLLGIINRFRGNPALDPHEYRKRVAAAAYDATVENIVEIGSDYLSEEAPDDWADRVFAFLAKRAPDEVAFNGEEGAEPSERAVISAMKGLGYFDPEAEEG